LPSHSHLIKGIFIMHMFFFLNLDFAFNVLLETCYFKSNYALTKISFVSKHMISFTPKKINLNHTKQWSWVGTLWLLTHGHIATTRWLCPWNSSLTTTWRLQGDYGPKAHRTIWQLPSDSKSKTHDSSHRTT
jgi:hypothetical protein